MPDFKPQFSPSTYAEFDIQDPAHYAPTPPSRTQRFVESARMSLTILSFCIGVTILALSADTIAVYNNTHVSPDFFIPLWPRDFNLRPTVAIVVGGALMVLVNGLSLAGSRVPAIRRNATVHTILSLVAPFIGGAAAVIATAFFYIVNDSMVSYSMQSWSCRWAGVGMNVQPHFGTLCEESRASLYLTVLMIPLECLVLGLAAVGVCLGRKRGEVERKGTPVSLGMS